MLHIGTLVKDNKLFLSLETTDRFYFNCCERLPKLTWTATFPCPWCDRASRLGSGTPLTFRQWLSWWGNTPVWK